jgi:hypothetical protein
MTLARELIYSWLLDDLGLHSASEDEAEGEPPYEADYEEMNGDEEEEEEEDGEEEADREKNARPFVPKPDIGMASADPAQIHSVPPIQKGQETSETGNSSTSQHI